MSTTPPEPPQQQGYSGLGRTPVSGAILPVPGNAEIAVWFIVVGLTGYVALGSILSAAVFPLAVWVLDPPEQAAILWLDVAVAAAIIWLHRGNIRRLLKGTENRFGRRGAPAGTR